MWSLLFTSSTPPLARTSTILHAMNPSPTLHLIASSPQVKPHHQRTQNPRRDDHLHTSPDLAEDVPRNLLAILSKHEQQHGRQPGPDEEAEGQEDRFEGEIQELLLVVDDVGMRMFSSVAVLGRMVEPSMASMPRPVEEDLEGCGFHVRVPRVGLVALGEWVAWWDWDEGQ